jgi:hypothetical protein
MTQIAVTEISFHSTSFCDRGGRLFWWRGELYRAISANYAAFCLSLFERGIVQRLVDKGLLIETELTDLTLPDFSLVLKHRRIPVVSYANEWCPEMLRDAALMVADLATELTEMGLTFTDATSWNVLFDRGRPVFVDFGSIESEYWPGAWSEYAHNFLTHFTYPLQLMAQGYGKLSRRLLADYDHEALEEMTAFMGYRRSVFSTNNAPGSKLYADEPISRIIRGLAHRSRKHLLPMFSSALPEVDLTQKYGLYLIQKLRREIAQVSLPTPSVHRSKRPSGERSSHLISARQWSPRKQTVYQVLQDLKPSSVLSLGSKKSFYPHYLAASLGARVIVIDANDRRIAHHYQWATANALPVLPVVMNIRDPSAGHGVCNQVTLPALKRLRCDGVLALNLVHKLVFKQYLTFEQIVQTFAHLSKQWLLVEFIAPEAPKLAKYRPETLTWYSQERFMAVLSHQFQSIRCLPDPSPSRSLILCQRENTPDYAHDPNAEVIWEATHDLSSAL